MSASAALREFIVSPAYWSYASLLKIRDALHMNSLGTLIYQPSS